MSFLKELLAKKESTPDYSVNLHLGDNGPGYYRQQKPVPEVPDEDPFAEETSEEEVVSRLTSIHRRLKGKFHWSSPKPETEASAETASERVQDFTDLVAGNTESDPETEDQEAELDRLVSAIEDDDAEPEEMAADSDEPAEPQDDLWEFEDMDDEMPEESAAEPEADVETIAETAADETDATVEADEAGLADEDVDAILSSVKKSANRKVSVQLHPVAPAEPDGEPEASPAAEDTPAAMDGAPDTQTDTQDEPEAVSVTATEQPAAEPKIFEVPAPAAGRSGRRAGRVKTRLLGFQHSQDRDADPFDPSNEADSDAGASFPVGWIVVVDGPGHGTAFTLHGGVSQIGRGEDQAIKLDFGDTSVSRSNHAAIAYDSEQRGFFLGQGGKANLVRLNGRPVLSTEELTNADLIRVGETTLRLVALCGSDFEWEQENQEDSDDAAIA